MKKSTMRWAQRGITHWLTEDLTVMIMKWTNQGHNFSFPEKQDDASRPATNTA